MLARLFFSMIFLGCALADFQLAHAQTGFSDSDYAALKERVKQLEQLVSRLEQKINQIEGSRGIEAQGQTAASTAQNQPAVSELRTQMKVVQFTEQPTVFAGRDTFAIVSRDRLFRLRIGGHLQADGKTAYDNKSYYSSNPHRLINNFNIRRARPIWEGSLGQYIDFRFMPDFGNGKTLLYDAYADIRIKPYAIIRGGKMKPPLGLEQLQGDADLTFIERSLATDLVPNRDEGFQLYGNFKGRLSYQAAIFNGAPVGQNYDGDVNHGKDVVGRLFATPFASSRSELLKGLGVGIAASGGRQEGAVLPSFNTTGGQIPFFSYGSGSGSSTVAPIATGHRLIFTPQLHYYNGPFGFMAEYVASTQKISAVVDGRTVDLEPSHHAWQVAGSWVITGEKKSFRGVVPRSGLDDRSKLAWGAWEVAARYTGLDVDPAVFSARFADPEKSAQSARAWSVGLHWYVNYFVKFQLDYEQTHFVGGNAGGDRPTEKVFEQRLQVAF